ncbi:YwqH-like family protein [Metabacillus sp. 84]|uniref:YwqH-like family protein n=1 Tax=Metabacillus sp. 84 TaxID=3404705 RepID=UPI003CEDCD3A
MSIASLQATLREKEKDLKRLQKCESDLYDHQEEFLDNKGLVMKPELTETTWAGDRSEQFDGLRESGMTDAYQEIGIDQFDDVFKALGDKIEQVTQEIKDLKASIASLEAEEQRKAAEESRLARKGL